MTCDAEEIRAASLGKLWTVDTVLNVLRDPVFPCMSSG